MRESDLLGKLRYELASPDWRIRVGLLPHEKVSYERLLAIRNARVELIVNVADGDEKLLRDVMREYELALGWTDNATGAEPDAWNEPE